MTAVINPCRPKVFGTKGPGGGGVSEPPTFLKNGSKYEVKIWYTYCPTYLGCKSRKRFDMLISSLLWQQNVQNHIVVFQCQSKQEINQYSDASQNVIFHNIKPKRTELIPTDSKYVIFNWP